MANDDDLDGPRSWYRQLPPFRRISSSRRTPNQFWTWLTTTTWTRCSPPQWSVLRRLSISVRSLFSRGRELANTLVRPDENIDDMGIVVGTEALKRHVLSLVPVCHSRLVKLQGALGALVVFHPRPSDYIPVEEVNVLWALEGHSFIRAYGGVLFTNHGFSWRKFEGVFFSSALRRSKSNMLALEGLFQKIGTATARDRDTVIHRIVALRTPRDAADDKALAALWFQHSHAAATGAEPPRDEGDAPWTTQVRKEIIKCSCDMQNELCGRRIVGNFVEWCDTGVFSRWHLRRVTTSTSPCCIPEANKRRVIEFLRTTFFDNAPVLECQLAAMCLTLRGTNIERAFMTWVLVASVRVSPLLSSRTCSVS